MENVKRFEKLFKKVEDSIKAHDIEDTGNTACAWETSSGAVANDSYQLCHASVNRAPVGCTLLASKTMKKSNGYTTSLGRGGWVGDKEARKFYDWLVNRSPYAQAFITKDPQYVIDKGIVAETNHPTNLIVGGFIAQRYCWENPSLVRNWLTLLDYGLSENMAFILCHSFNLKDTNVESLGLSAHVALESGGLSTQGVKNFLKAKWVHPTEVYSKRTSYEGITRLWGNINSTRSIGKELLKKVEAKGKPVGHNVFREVFEKGKSGEMSVLLSDFKSQVKGLCKDMYGEEAIA